MLRSIRHLPYKIVRQGKNNLTKYKNKIILLKFLPLENIGVNGFNWKPNQPQNSPYSKVICDLTTIVKYRKVVAFHLFSHQCKYYIPCNKMLFYFTQQNVTTVWQVQNLRAYINPSQSGNLLQTGLVIMRKMYDRVWITNW